MNVRNLNQGGLTVAIVLAAAWLLTACSNQDVPTEGERASTKVLSHGKASADGATCSAHGAAKELCFICDAGLRDKGRLWCNEHGRYEDRCWICHPELEDEKRLYCKEHSLYEDECFLCHPELLDEQPANVEDSQDGRSEASNNKTHEAGLMCQEHGLLERQCGICHPELLGQNQADEGLKVRLPSSKSAERAGLTVGTPSVARMFDGIRCLAELSFDMNHLAQITPLVGGIVTSVEVDLGTRVQEGDLLARVTSVAIGEAQSSYLRALAEHELQARAVERERKLRAEGISSERDLQEAEALYDSSRAAAHQARQQLMVYGFDQRQIEALAEQKGTPGVLELRAPFAGEIVERTAVRGGIAQAGQPLFTLADPTKLWAMVQIPESQLSRSQIGQKVELAIESLPGETFAGTLTWLAAQVDERTRMALGRVELRNNDGRLKAQMFARAHILTNNSERATIVPQSAIQNVGGRSVVFIKSENDLFEARPVQLGGTQDGKVEITSGLKPDEPVVLTGSFALKSQFLISLLGAGCVH